MRWQRGQSSEYVDDRRGRSRGGSRAGGLALKGGLPAVIVAVLVTLLGGNLVGGDGGGGGGGVDLDDVLGQLGAAPAAPAKGSPEITQGTSGVADDELEDFMRFVMNDVQTTWEEIFAEGGERYPPTSLVLFTDAVATGGCGSASAAVGPFYCPPDETAYIDLAFYRELRDRFGAPGDFAQAYVIAHEVGHHVQNVLGTSAAVTQTQQQQPELANELSVALELQADCYAGVWAHSTYERGLLESGDLDEGLAAAAAVGDDRIQRQSGQRVNPESWTHGSSEQRTRWFQRGFDAGDPGRCDTFAEL